MLTVQFSSTEVSSLASVLYLPMPSLYISCICCAERDLLNTWTWSMLPFQDAYPIILPILVGAFVSASTVPFVGSVFFSSPSIYIIHVVPFQANTVWDHLPWVRLDDCRLQS